MVVSHGDKERCKRNVNRDHINHSNASTFSMLSQENCPYKDNDKQPSLQN